MNERPLTDKILKALRALGIPCWKAWQGPMSNRGVSDIVGTIPPDGRALYVEVKKPGEFKPPEKGLTPLQRGFLTDHMIAGAVTICADSVEQVLYEVKKSMT